MKYSQLLAAIMAVAVSASTLRPPVLPLIVRNPYLSAWLADARNPPWESWPMFWTGDKLGFSIMASSPENGLVFPLLGRPQDSIHTDAISYPSAYEISYDASTTNITYTLGSGGATKTPTTVVISFLSPITPSSTLRQSLPVAYISIHVKGQSGLNIYTDINGQWLSGDDGNSVSWDIGGQAGSDAHPAIKSWQISRQTEQLFTEIRDRCEWGTIYFTAPEHVCHQSGQSEATRQSFVQTGRLNNETDGQSRGIMDREPVFAFSTFLGPKSAEGQSSITFTLGLIQDTVAQFASARGHTDMRPLWASYFPTPADMLRFHYDDLPAAHSLASDYSNQLDHDAGSMGPKSYRDIVSLSARQVLGATVFSGTPQDPILFLKEISSNGNFQTVDVIYPAFPFFLYTNPNWLMYLLEPLLEYQLSGQYPNNYSIHDIGTHFPNGTGHPDGRDEYMPVEECGNMLIMALALVNAMRDGVKLTELPAAGAPLVTGVVSQRRGIPDTASDSWTRGREGLDRLSSHSGDKAARKWVKDSYRLWKQWVEYLIDKSLVPENQLCTDDFAGALANQTNLALKGIIGIRAMSELAAIVGEEQEAQYYKNISVSYISKWQEYGISRDGTHAKLSYDWFGSWTTIYNLFTDSLLCFHLPPGSTAYDPEGSQKPIGRTRPDHFIPDTIYSIQSEWYAAVVQKYGLPLDSRHLYTKSDWEFFASAVASSSTRHKIIEGFGRWVNETVTDRPMTDLYETEGSGDFPPVRFMARPVVGGHFAPLSLQQACGGKAMRGLQFLDAHLPREEYTVEGALGEL